MNLYCKYYCCKSNSIGYYNTFPKFNCLYNSKLIIIARVQPLELTLTLINLNKLISTYNDSFLYINMKLDAVNMKYRNKDSKYLKDIYSIHH